MLDKITSLAGSWKTTLLGVLALICSGTDLVGLLPEQYKGTLTGVCMILVSAGVIVAKDFNKTNAIVATRVPQTVAVEPSAPDQVIVKEELQK